METSSSRITETNEPVTLSSADAKTISQWIAQSTKEQVSEEMIQNAAVKYGAMRQGRIDVWRLLKSLCVHTP